MFSSAMAQSNFQENLGGNVNLDMIYVQSGQFTMGCSDGDNDCEPQEKPTHTVTLSDYYIGKTELTEKQWVAVMGSSSSGGGCSVPGGNAPPSDKPKTNITWYDAIEFTCKLSEKTGKKYRLATESEFEFAARGGNSNHGYRFSGSNDADAVAWHSGNTPKNYGFASVQNVGTKAPNELGIYDMSGNVFEWTYDTYGTPTSSAQTNPTGPANLHSQKVRRGGSYDQPAYASRVSSRRIRSIEGKDGSIGLRVALSVADSRPQGMANPCEIHMPPRTGGDISQRDKRLFNANGEAWVYEAEYQGTKFANVLIIKENGTALYTQIINGNRLNYNDVSGEWYSLNNFSLNIVSNSSTKKYIYFIVDGDNMSMMPDGDMPGRYVRMPLSQVAGASGITVPSVANQKPLNQLVPSNAPIFDMSDPPTDGRDSRLIEGANQAWLQDNVALNAGGSHRYRFDFDSQNEVRFVVYDPPSSTTLAEGSWFTIGDNFLRITKEGKNYDYLYTVTSNGNTYYHISFQPYEPGDFRMFEKVNAGDVPYWIEPTFDGSCQGSSTYIPPGEDEESAPTLVSTPRITVPLVTVRNRTLNVNANSDVRIRVVNLVGKTVANFNATSGATLSLNGIPSGVYIIEAKSLNGHKTTSPVILK